MKKIKLKQLLLNFGFLGLSLITIFGAQLTVGSHISLAADPKTEACEALKKIDGSTVDCSNKDALEEDSKGKISGIVRSVIGILSLLVGAVSVIMVIIGAFKYVTSNGDSNATKGAKDTIMYALIGLLLVGFAQTIVRFVWSNS